MPKRRQTMEADMAVFEIWLNADLKEAQRITPMAGNIFSQDERANKVGVIVTDGGEPVALSGTVQGSIIRADGVTIMVEGAIDGNKAFIVLPDSAYAVVGEVQISIRLIDGTEHTTLAACRGHVHRTTTGVVVDPGYVSNTAVLPPIPAENGTYSLKITVNNGAVAYSWG